MAQAEDKKKNWFARHKIVTVVLAVIVFGMIAGAANGDTQTSTSAPTDTTKTEETAVKKEPTSAKWDIEAAYAKIENGMTKAQVEEVTGKKSDSCTESASEYVGKSESCSYGNAFIDKGSIFVIYMQDVVNSKTKSTY